MMLELKQLVASQQDDKYGHILYEIKDRLSIFLEFSLICKKVQKRKLSIQIRIIWSV